jgi:sulfide:quinone oxidoreductase
VAGGGVAAIEAVGALRALAGSRAEITLVSRAERVQRRAKSVLTPFGGEAPAPFSLSEVARRVPCALHIGELERVEVERRLVVLRDGERLASDRLVIAIGAIAQPAFSGAITFGGAEDASAVSEALQTAERLAFVSPTASEWSLPLYELALMSALEQPEASIAVVTAETAPLWIVGAEAGDAVRDLFSRRGVGLLTGVRVLPPPRACSRWTARSRCRATARSPFPPWPARPGRAGAAARRARVHPGRRPWRGARGRRRLCRRREPPAVIPGRRCHSGVDQG